MHIYRWREARSMLRTMPAKRDEAESYEFGPFRFVCRGKLLYRGEELLTPPPKVAETLCAFLERPGLILSKEDLFARIWPDTVLEDGNLAQSIFQLRRLLGDAEDGEPYIETLPRRGYRFRVPVRASVSTMASQSGEPPAGDAFWAPTSIELPQAKARTPWASRLGWFALLVLGVVLWASLGRQRDEPAPNTPSQQVRTRLAVLPFRQLAGSPLDPALEIGLADALITRLSSLPGLVVRPTGAVLRFAGADLDVPRIARALEVDAVLEGRLQQDGDHVRASLQLVSAPSGETLWSGQFDQTATGLFELEDRLSSAIAAALLPAVGMPAGLLDAGTRNPEAHRLYLEGRTAALRMIDLDAGIAALRRATTLDPTYARAWSGLAFAYMMAVETELAPREAQPLALEAARQALRLDPSLLEARLMAATVAWQYEWDVPAAQREFDTALAQHPGSAEAWAQYAYFQAVLGDRAVARSAAERARTIDSVSNDVAFFVASTYFALGDDEAVLPIVDRLIQGDPGAWLPHLLRARALERLSRAGEGLAERAEAKRLAPLTAEVTMDLAAALARAGRRENARSLQTELELPAAGMYVSSFHRALVAAELGDETKATAELERAIDERSWYVTWLRSVPDAEALRRLEAFPRLAARLPFLAVRP